MALYEDYLNQNNLYSRPSALMSDVNSYLGANKASLPMKPDSLGSMMGSSSLNTTGGLSLTPSDEYRNKDDYTGDIEGDKDPPDPGDGDPNGGGYTPSGDLVSKFLQDLGSLDDTQQRLLLDFIEGGAGDYAKGVSDKEYARLFGVSEDYAGRFGGYPRLTNLSSDISNIYAFGDQQRGFEQRAAQQAMIQQSGKFQGGRGFGGFGRGQGMFSSLNRRSMMDTLKQRQASVEESVASKYGNLLAGLQSSIRGGFSAAGQILQEDSGAAWAPPGEEDIWTPPGYTGGTPGEGETWTDDNNNIWEYTNGEWRRQSRG